MSWSLAVFAGLAILTAASGAIFTPGAWYRGLRKPSWTPPDWLFAPAWTVIFAMIAAAGWLAWEAAGWSWAMAAFGLNLVLNFGWSWLFFGLKRPDWAFAEVLLLWASIALCIALFAPHSAWAAWLFVPYLLWVTFAAALNWKMWRLNPP